jgi:hypothetical protein
MSPANGKTPPGSASPIQVPFPKWLHFSSAGLLGTKAQVAYFGINGGLFRPVPDGQVYDPYLERSYPDSKAWIVGVRKWEEEQKRYIEKRNAQKQYHMSTVVTLSDFQKKGESVTSAAVSQCILNPPEPLRMVLNPLLNPLF